MAKELVQQYSTSNLEADGIGITVYDMVTRSKESRRSFERRWYDNNFFYDGHHFRYLSREANKVVDLSDRATLYAPMRAIPKSSAQVVGVANLLMGTEPTPIIYPDKVSSAQWPPLPRIDPQTGKPQTDPLTGLTQFQPNPEYLLAVEEARRVAKLSGHWLTEEYKEQELIEKLSLMCILTGKHGISYIQIWPDADGEEIKTAVFDAFDIFVVGTVNELEDSPFLIKSLSRTISEIKADPRFDPEKVALISPDNRFASSDIKDSYMRARYGGVTRADSAATILEKESFIKEYVNDENTPRIKAQKNGAEILKDRDKGDVIIRHSFVEGNVTVLDEYLDMDTYPFVDLRYEPGPLYQTPLIERFIPQNKSLDLIVSRVERYIHTMVTGSWSKRKGDDYEMSNTAGGQVIEYNVTPPVQNQIAPIPQFVFEFMQQLESMIEEQGTSTNILARLPKGVRSGSAISSLKEAELSKLAIPLRRLQNAVKKVSQQFLDLADKYFITPKTVYYLDKGEPQYFDVIGASAKKKRQAVKVGTPDDVISLSHESKVDVSIQGGMGYTRDAQVQAAEKLANFMVQMAQLGLVDPQVIKVFMQSLFDAYGFGATQEVMDAIDEYKASGTITDDQLTKMKIAMATVMKDLHGTSAVPSTEQRTMENQVGMAQTLSDMQQQAMQGQQGGQPAPQQPMPQQPMQPPVQGAPTGAPVPPIGGVR